MDQKGIREGMTVRSTDGEKLGKVIACEPDHFLIEKGFFFPKDYLARYDEVRSVSGDDIVLDLSASDVRAGRAGEPQRSSGEGMRASGSASSTSLGGGATDEVKVPVVEEELQAEKQMREAGEVRVKKTVKTEHKQISVPVTKEEVHVERVPASGREATTGDATFQEGTVSVPVREEEVEIRKRPVVREEVRVSKTARQVERRADADVRREDVDIEKTGDLERTNDADIGRGEPEE